MNEKSAGLRMSGQPISPGLAVGQAFLYRDILLHAHGPAVIGRHEVDREQTRLSEAIAEVLRDLQALSARVERELDAEVAGIFRVHQAILEDPSTREDLLREVEEELIKAEEAVKRVFRRVEARFRTLADENLQERGADFADVGRRVLHALRGIQAHTLEKMPANSVLVAPRLLPSDTVFLSRRSTVAVLVERGGPGSHVAILTREMGVPGVAQIPGLLKRVSDGDLLAVDGFRGEVLVQPDPETLGRFRRRITHHSRSQDRDRASAGRPVIAPDGTRVEVLANVGKPEDAVLAARNGADGIGLYRIENLYLSRRLMPTEEELLEELSCTLEPLRGRPVVVRLLDVGGDKNIPFLDLPEEPNPFLGRRGVRLLLEFPDLLRTQIRAILRLSDRHDVRILVPMVTVSCELERLRGLIEQAAAGLGVQPVPLGAMIETPGAALTVGELLPYTQFLSIGSNDLTQYTMAASRENPLVVEYFLEDHPAVLRLIGLVVAESGDVPVSLCGELAGQPEALPALLRMGVRSFSAAPALIPQIKESIRRIRPDLSS